MQNASKVIIDGITPIDIFHVHSFPKHFVVMSHVSRPNVTVKITRDIGRFVHSSPPPLQTLGSIQRKITLQIAQIMYILVVEQQKTLQYQKVRDVFQILNFLNQAFVRGDDLRGFIRLPKTLLQVAPPRLRILIPVPRLQNHVYAIFKGFHVDAGHDFEINVIQLGDSGVFLAGNIVEIIVLMKQNGICE